MSDEKEDGNSTPVNEVKDRKYGIGITRFFKVLSKDETRPKPCINPIEHMKFVNKSPGKPKKRALVSPSKRRRTSTGGAHLQLKNKASVDESNLKTEFAKDVSLRKEIVPRRVSPRKRQLKKGSRKSSGDISAKESSDPYSVDNSEDSDMIISYSAFIKDTLLKKKPSDPNESSRCPYQKANTPHGHTQKSITKFLTVNTPVQNGSSASPNVKNKKSHSKNRPKRSNSASFSNSEDESKSVKRLNRRASQQQTNASANDIGDANDGNLRRSSRLRKPILDQLSIENFDEESTQSNDGLEKEKYACKVSVVDEENGKQSIKLRLTRISDKCKKSKAIVEKAQKLIRKSKRRFAANQAAKVEENIVDAENDKSSPKEVEILDDVALTKNYPVAPLFLKSKKSKKNEIKFDEATIERRNQFLRSGIPESLQSQQQNLESEDKHPDFCFPTIGHVTQSDEADAFGSISNFSNFNPTLRDMDVTNTYSKWIIGSVSNTNKLIAEVIPGAKNTLQLRCPTKITSEQLPKILEEIQDRNPSINVMQKYNSYASRKDPFYLNELHNIKKRVIGVEEKSLSSTLKRRKTNRNGVEQIVAKIKQKSIQSSGDSTDCVSTLLADKSSSLESDIDIWSNVYRPETTADIIGNETVVKDLKTFLSEFCIGEKRSSKKADDDISDYSGGSQSDKSRAALVIGPTGCGKSVSVYTIARELGYKVLEINASARRTSKFIVSQLQEATQSHRVKEATIQSAFALQLESGQIKQETATMSLILFEDVDIVFTEDEGFWSAVNDFISTTKIPVVLTTSDESFEERCCIKGNYETYTFKTPDLNSQVVHMQILCLTNFWNWNWKDISNLISYNGNNFRQSVLLLQYLCKSEANYREKCEEMANNKGSIAIPQYITNYLSLNCDNCTFHKEALYTAAECHLAKFQNDHPSCNQTTNGTLACISVTTEKKLTSHSSPHLKTLVRTLEDLCMLDCFSKTETEINFSGNYRARVIDGIDDADRSYNDDFFSWQLSSDIQSTILNISQRLSTTNQTTAHNGEDDLYDTLAIVQKDYACIKSFKNLQDTVLAHMHHNHRLNSRAFCLDILNCFKTICRSEKEKQAASNKRSGRFLHYLSTTGFYFEPFTISELCKNLGPNYSAN